MALVRSNKRARADDPGMAPTDGQVGGGSGGANGEAPQLGQGGLAVPGYEFHQPDSSPWTETRTVLHHWEGYLSCNELSNKIDLNRFSIVQNNPYQAIAAELVAANRSGVNGGAEGIGNGLAVASQVDSRLVFPRTVRGSGGATINEGLTSPTTATWVKWYEKLYRFYATLECNWEVTFWYPLSGNSNENTKEAVIMWWDQSYVQNNQSDIRPVLTSRVVANVPSTVTPGEEHLKSWKGIKSARITNKTNNDPTRKNKITIKGKWTANDAPGSVRNIADIKQWYNTGAAPSPNWIESTLFAIVRDAESYGENRVNCKITVDKVVQYKDLKDGVKYAGQPVHGNNAIHLRPGIDDIQYPYPRESDSELYNPAVPAYPIV
jgi:hypothetical protein